MREKLTFANVMSSLAVFLALGGSAIAIKANSVGSRAIKDESLKGRDVKDGKLKGKDLKRESLTGDQIDEERFDFGRFVSARSAGASCDPNSNAFVECGKVSLSSVQSSFALLVVAGEKGGSVDSFGECRLRANGQEIVDGTRQLGGSGSGAEENFAMTAIARGFYRGGTDFSLACNEGAGDINYSADLSVLLFSVEVGRR